MAENMPLVARIMVQHGGDGPPTGPGVGAIAPSGDASGEPKETTKNIKTMAKTMVKNTSGVFKNLGRTLGIQVTMASILKQSQVFTGYIGTIFQLMGALVDVILAPFLPILIPAIKLLASFIPTARDLMQDIFDGLSKGFKVVSGWISSLMGFLGIKIGKLSPNIVEGIKKVILVTLIAGFLLKMFGLLKFFWKGSTAVAQGSLFYLKGIFRNTMMMGAGIGKGTKGSGRFFGRATKFFGRGLMRFAMIGTLLTGMGGILTRGFSGLGTALKGGFSLLRSGLGLGIEATTRLVPRLVPPIKASASLLQRASKLAASAAHATGRFIAAGASRVGNFLKGNIIKYGQSTAAVVRGMWGGVTKGLTAAKNAIAARFPILGKTVNAVKAGVSIAKNAIVNGAKAGFNAAKAGLTTAKNAIVNGAKAGFNVVKGGLTTARTFLAGKLATVGSFISKGATAGFNVVKGGLTVAKTFISGKISAMASVVSKGVSAAKSAITTGIAKGKQWATSTASKITSGLSSLGSKIGGFFSGLGSKISGVISGLGSKITSLANKIPGVKAAKDIAKKGADIAGKAAKSGWGFMKKGFSAVTGGVSKAVTSVKNVVQSVRGGVSGVAGDATKKAGGLFGRITGGLSKIAKPLASVAVKAAHAARALPLIAVPIEAVYGAYKTYKSFKEYGKKAGFARLGATIGAVAATAVDPTGIASAGVSIGSHLGLDYLERRGTFGDKRGGMGGGGGPPSHIGITIVQQNNIGTELDRQSERAQIDANRRVTVNANYPPGVGPNANR